MFLSLSIVLRLINIKKLANRIVNVVTLIDHLAPWALLSIQFCINSLDKSEFRGLQFPSSPLLSGRECRKLPVNISASAPVKGGPNP